MKKLRFQPTFASLTEAELEQLASDVQRETYDAVRLRVCKPRSEGGLDLHFTSNSPLVRLHNKKNRLDLINAQITSGQKLTLAQLDTITAGSGPCYNHSEHRAPEEIYDAIMSATYILVTEQDNTPHQLLALQRLADFPARAEIREQSAQIRAQSAQDLSRLRNQTLAHRTERNQITRAREQRAAELHTHKIQLDLRKQTLKEKTAAFAKLRLNRNPNLNPNLFPESPGTSNEPTTQHSAPGTENLDAPIQNPVHLVQTPASKSETRNQKSDHNSRSERLIEGNTLVAGSGSPIPVDNSASPKIKILIDEDGETFVRRPGPCPLPDDVVIKNRAYAKKLLAGLIDPETGEELSGPITPATPAPADATSLNIESVSKFNSDLRKQKSEIASTLKSEIRDHESEIPSNPDHHAQNSSSANSAPSASSALNPDVSATVDRYTVDRAREYIAHDQRHTPWPYRHSPPAFITEARHCPCGQPCPCPTHETIPDIGPFPPEFWSLSPFSTHYAACLQDRNLPYRQPKEYLA